MLLAIVAIRDLEIHQMDVVSAYVLSERENLLAVGNFGVIWATYYVLRVVALQILKLALYI